MKVYVQSQQELYPATWVERPWPGADAEMTSEVPDHLARRCLAAAAEFAEAGRVLDAWYERRGL